jgi:hypothetical protein
VPSPRQTAAASPNPFFSKKRSSIDDRHFICSPAKKIANQLCARTNFLIGKTFWRREARGAVFYLKGSTPNT